MELLKERIRKDGKVKGTDVLKVDSFLNHQMDIALFATWSYSTIWAPNGRACSPTSRSTRS